MQVPLQQKVYRLLRRYPALSRRGWLPEDSGWSELDDLRTEHLRLLDARENASHELNEVRKKFEAEDDVRQKALRDSFKTGRDVGELPEQTPPEVRESAIAAGEEKLDAINEALEESLTEALALLADNREQWLSDLVADMAEADQKRQQARQLVAEADKAAGEVERMRRWLDRNSGGRLGPIQWEGVLAPSNDRLTVLSEDVSNANEDADYISERNARLLGHARVSDAEPGIEVIE